MTPPYRGSCSLHPTGDFHPHQGDKEEEETTSSSNEEGDGAAEDPCGSSATLEAMNKYYDHLVPTSSTGLDACSQRDDESLIKRLPMNRADSEKLHPYPCPSPSPEKALGLGPIIR